MSRILKGTRARGLPPKVLLSQRQDATGSFPTKWRTSSDNRTGKYPVFFNDNKVVPFNQYEAADYDIPGGIAYVEKVENVGAVETGGTKTVTYPAAFAGSPIVVISELSSANGDSSQNVNAFLSGIEINNFTVKFSSQFTGSIVYRAVYDPSPGTLRVVERKPRYPNAFTRFIAKEVTLANNNAVDITFNDFGDDTAENFVTFFDSYVNGQADIWPNITTQTRTLVALTASSIATATVEYERFHGLHNRGIIYPLGMNQATILAGLSQENQIEMYGSVSFMSGAVVNQPTKWIVASGSMKKNVADTFVTFTPGQDIQVFRDNANPATDGKISSSVSGINPFYATGSAVNVTGQGFQQPLWSKSKIEIDITPAVTQTLNTLETGSTGNYIMGYWNPNTKLYEGIGSGKGIASYPSTSSGLRNFLDEQTIGFGSSLLNVIGQGLEPYGFNIIGRQISSFGFPYHKKFQPTGSQQIKMSNYISEPFLLEKIVLEFSGSIKRPSLPTANTKIHTFFLLNTKNYIPNYTSPAQIIQYKNINDLLAPLTITTASNIGNTVCDIIDHLQMCGSSSSDYYGYLNRELLIKNPPQFSGQFILNSTVKTSIQYNEGINASFSGDILGLGPAGEFIESLNYSGRNQLGNPSGRDWVNAIENPVVIGTGSYFVGSSYKNTLNINTIYTKKNPYLLLPTDNLTFGYQLPWSDRRNFFDYNSITFSPQGINKITLYGSSLRINPETNQLEEYHDSLNQLCSSNSIHEEIGD